MKNESSLATPWVSIQRIAVSSAHFAGVIRLHTENKATLGPFPTGAFEEYASRKQILAAVDAKGVMAAYLLYRVAKYQAVVVHLAIAAAFRGRGLSRLIVDRLKLDTKHLLGISLRCRRDYGLAGMWSNLGFTVRHSKAGRGADGALLDFWWFDHNHADLFSIAATRSAADSFVSVALDANVFYDLVCDGRPHAEDTRILEADWLQDSLRLCITSELYNEIHRGKDEEQKRRNRIAAQTLHELKTDSARVRELEMELAPIFEKPVLARNESDIRQIAHAIAGDVPFFITRDAPLLHHSEHIFEKYGMRIIHPADLVARFDALRREAEYRPASLEGSRWRVRLVTAEDISSITKVFKHSTGERDAEFEARVRHYLVRTDCWTSRLIVDDAGHAAVYLVISHSPSETLKVPLLRHADHPLTATLLRHVLHEMNRHVSGSRSRAISVTDSQLAEPVTAALTELGFLPEGNTWWKLSVFGVTGQESLAGQINASELPELIKQALSDIVLSTAASERLKVARLEHVLSPIKMTSSATASFIVSIRPGWAAHFFDIPMGAQMLMDLNERLHLGIEGAYYCSANNRHLTFPARILWYVSGDGSMAIKACSHLDDLMTGTPKELYGRLRHLGVYSWKNVFEAAGGDLQKHLMAFRFSRTERFAHPIPLAEITRLGIPQPQNPRRITDDQFATLYRIGMNLDA